jgi:nicotinamidase-related amidase
MMPRRKMMNIAMLIIDMQKGCLEMGQARETMLEAVDYINEVSGYFRKAGKPVVVIQDMTVDQGPGSPGYEVIDDLVVDETDILVAKTHNNSFYETQLENILHDLGVEFLVVSGFAAEYCVLFSLNGAKERGFGAALLQHGIAGVSKDRVLDTLLIRPVVSYETVAYMLKG